MTIPSAIARPRSSPLRYATAAVWHAATIVLRSPLALMRTPLARNGYALVASAALTSVLGVAFWVLAARLYTEQQVGLGAALISTLAVLGNAAQLNLGNVLNRFVPAANARAGALILVTYGVAAVAALFMSVGFLFVVGHLVAALGFLTDNTWTAAWFVVAVVAWTVFALQDSALAGLRQAVWVPLENAAYSLVKIALLVLLANSVLADLGLFAAWTFPLLIVVAVVNLFMFRHLLPAHSAPLASAAELDPRGMARFLGWDYVGSLSMAVAIGVAPLLVLEIVGPAANASYHIAWTIGYSLYLVGRSMDISLLAEGAADPRRLSSLAADALIQTMILVTTGAALIVIGAPLIMALFGPSYVDEGTTLLRILAFSTVPWSFITIHLAVVRARGHTAAVAAVQGATLLIVLGLGTALLPNLGTLGMAVAWLTAHTTVAVGISIAAVLKGGPDRAIDWLIGLASSGARLVAAVTERRPRPTAAAAADPEPIVQALLQETGEPDAGIWRSLYSVISQSDTMTLYLGEQNALGTTKAQGRPEGARVLFKSASSSEGVAALERSCKRLRSLQFDPRVKDCGFLLPEILAINRSSDTLRLIERIIPGEDGREVLRRPTGHRVALKAAARAIAGLHEQTADDTVIGEAWLAEWIDRPAEFLEHPVSTLLTARRRRAAIASFHAEQRAFWQDLPVRLGWGHGDFSPGNIMFTERSDRDRESAGRVMKDGCAEFTISGIIDWDNAMLDTPSGYDACYLAITARALVRGEEVGQTVCDLLRAPRWDVDEQAWLGENAASAAGLFGWPRDPKAIRAMVGLAWLRHVAANIEKSRRYAGSRIWTAANVDLVLREFAKDRATK